MWGQLDASSSIVSLYDDWNRSGRVIELLEASDGEACWALSGVSRAEANEAILAIGVGPGDAFGRQRGDGRRAYIA